MPDSGNLFAASPAGQAHAPLAERMRPKSLDEVVGQTHLLGPGKPLRVAFESGRPHSMIFWGPPGDGKTTLARLRSDERRVGKGGSVRVGLGGWRILKKKN